MARLWPPLAAVQRPFTRVERQQTTSSQCAWQHGPGEVRSMIGESCRTIQISLPRYSISLWRNFHQKMTRHNLAILIGGVLPALCFSLSSVAQKFSTTAGIGSGPLLVFIGLTVAAVGAVFSSIDGDWSWTRTGAAYACFMGLAWGAGIACIAVALKKYGAQISQLVPLYNMNTLLAVLIGMVAFAEWRAVQPTKILIAALLIIAGGVLASKA